MPFIYPSQVKGSWLKRQPLAILHELKAHLQDRLNKLDENTPEYYLSRAHLNRVWDELERREKRANDLST